MDTIESGTPGGPGPDTKPDARAGIAGTGTPRAAEDGKPAPHQAVIGRDEYAHSTEGDLEKRQRPGEQDDGGPVG